MVALIEPLDQFCHMLGFEICYVRRDGNAGRWVILDDPLDGRSKCFVEERDDAGLDVFERFGKQRDKLLGGSFAASLDVG